MNTYYYQIRNSANKVSGSGSVRAETMDEAYDNTLERQGITIETETFGEGSIMEGAVASRKYKRQGKTVSLLIGRVLAL